jgi:hypothetical protein
VRPSLSWIAERAGDVVSPETKRAVTEECRQRMMISGRRNVPTVSRGPPRARGTVQVPGGTAEDQDMSYHIQFVRRLSGESFEDVLERLESRFVEDGDAAPISDQWCAVADRLRRRLGEIDVQLAPDSCELTYEPLGLQVSFAADEASVSLPSRYAGEAADEVADAMRDVVELVHRATGLEAYDPQTGEAFDGGDTGQVMRDIHARMAGVVATGPGPSA